MAPTTLPPAPSAEELRRARAARRAGIAALALFVALGALGVFGPKTSLAHAEGSGYELTVTYPSVTRPGLPIRWEIEVRHEGGFSGPIELRTTFDYIHLLDISNTEPQASSSSAGAGFIDYVFTPPPGAIFRVSMDGNAEPGEHAPQDVWTSVMVGGRAVVSVGYRTVVVP